jgi:hypothetical protein
MGMALRKGHGAGKGTPRVEVLPPDELGSVGGVAALPEISGPNDKDALGRFLPGHQLAARGGRKGYSKLASRIDMGDGVSPTFSKYKQLAASFRRAHCRELAQNVGGGVCGTGPSLLVAQASRAAAWSAYYNDIAMSGGGDATVVLQSLRMGETARQHLLAAHEMCAKEAKSRPPGEKRGPLPWEKRVTEEQPVDAEVSANSDTDQAEIMPESSTSDAEGANDMQSVQPTEDDETGEDES